RGADRLRGRRSGGVRVVFSGFFYLARAARALPRGPVRPGLGTRPWCRAAADGPARRDRARARLVGAPFFGIALEPGARVLPPSRPRGTGGMAALWSDRRSTNPAGGAGYRWIGGAGQ